MKKILGKSRGTHAVLRCCVLLAVLLGLPATMAADEIIRVTGKVICKKLIKAANRIDGGKKDSVAVVPVFGVNISLDGRLLAQTDADGRFAFDTYSNARLQFSSVSYKTRTAKVNGRNYMEVEMEEVENLLGEAVATAKRVKKVSVDKTEIEQRGDTFFINTIVRVPKEFFSSNSRMVCQPYVRRYLQGDSVLIRPLVYDGWEYNTTQKRMYDFDIKKDPLAPYIVVKADSLRDERISKDGVPYHTVEIIPKAGGQVKGFFMVAVEDYHRITYRDTFFIAQGTIFPLRHLDYSFTPAQEITDKAYYPTPEEQPRETNGAINLRFPVGKSTLELSDSTNAAEVATLNALLMQVAGNKNCSIREFQISGTSSPEGQYRKNLQLANDRMKTALNLIVGQLDDNTRRNMKVSSHASVEGWQKVADLMRKDSLNAEADQVERIVQRYKNIDDQGRQIARLSCYAAIKEKYLPQLRHVNYKMVYTVYRPLTVEEIREQYNKDYRLLSRFEFFTLYRGEQDMAKREKICRQALEMFPSFMIAANDLSANLINQKRSDYRILEPFVGKKAPAVLNRNQSIALLDSMYYSAADTLANYLPDDEDGRFVKAVVEVMNGKFQHSDLIASTSPFNATLLLLAQKQNEEALKMAMELPEDDPMTHYVRAMCLNRLEKVDKADNELQKAFRMKPELKKVAEMDADVNTLIVKELN